MPQQVPFVPAQDVPQDAVVLDVREDDEWVHGHIDGATHIPMGDVPARLDDLPEGDPLYVICRSGGRSHNAAMLAQQAGYAECYNVLEGFEGDKDGSGHRSTTGGWRHAGLPWVQS